MSRWKRSEFPARISHYGCEEISCERRKTAPVAVAARLQIRSRAWPRGGVETFDLIPDGFVFTRRNKPVRMLWNEVVQIDAGMREYLTLDLFFAVIHTAERVMC